MNAHDGARRGRRKLPSEELSTQIVAVLKFQTHRGVARRPDALHCRVRSAVVVVLHAKVHEEAVIAVHARIRQRLCSHGHDAAAFLAGALGDKLLHPEPEAGNGRRRDQGELVAAPLRQGAQHRPQPSAGVIVGGDAGGTRFAHAVRPVQQCRNVHAHQGRRRQAEVGEDRESSADIRGVREHAPEPFAACHPLQGRTGVGNGNEVAWGCLPPHSVFHQYAESPVQHVGLNGCARLGGDQEQRSRRVNGALGRAHCVRHGGVQHHELRVPRGAAEGLAQHLGPQAAAAHAQEDGVAESGGAHVRGEGLQGGNLPPHHLGHLQPAQAVC